MCVYIHLSVCLSLCLCLSCLSTPVSLFYNTLIHMKSILESSSSGLLSWIRDLVPASSVAWASLVAKMVKLLPAMRETWVWFLGQEDPLKKEMAIHSSTLAWKIPWTEEPDRLQSMGLQRVGHDWAISLFTFLSHLECQFLFSHPVELLKNYSTFVFFSTGLFTRPSAQIKAFCFFK